MSRELTDAQMIKIENLSEKISAIKEREEIYQTEDETSPTPDYLMSGWGEGDWDDIYKRVKDSFLDDFEILSADFNEAVVKKYESKRKFMEVVFRDFISLNCQASFRSVSGSIHSAEIGEVEVSFPAEMEKEIKNLSKEEIIELERQTGENLHINNDSKSQPYLIVGLTPCYWHVVIDTEKLNEAMSGTISQIKKDKIERTGGRQVDRDSLKNVGNTNGRDIRCKKCGEPYENCYVVEDFSQDELNRFVVLGPQLDDEFGDNTRITGLNGCPSCLK